MAQAYIRQSTFSDGDTITAALFNNEYNQLVNAFAYSSSSASNTGHRHDGTAGQGGNIFKIGDLDFLNKVEIDSTNNRVGFYVEVSSAAVEQLRIQDGALVPVTDSDIDLGTTSLRFKDTFTDSITTTGNVDVGGNLTVTGTTTFNGGTITMGDANTDNVVFGADIDSSIIPDDDDSYDLGSSSQEWRNLFIDGTANIDSLVADTADINGGTIDGAVIGGSSAAAITGTAITGTSFVIGSADISEAELETIDGITAGTVAASKAIVVDSNKDFTGARNITLTGELDAGSLDVSGNVDVDGTLETDALSINGTAVTSTAAELNILDGVTSTAAELNILDGVTATAAEINALDGITSTVTELNILDGVTASAADINLIDGITNGTVIASKAIITDSNKDITGGRNITISGELDAATLDISGDADIDGTLEADAITIGGITLAETISDTVGAMVSSNTETGISVTYDDSDNTLDFVIGSGVITNAMLAGSIANSKLANSSVTISDGSNSTAVALGGTLTIQGTSNEVEVAESSGTVTVGLPAATQVTTSLGIGGGSTNGVVISQGAISIKNGGTQSYIDFYCESSNAHYARLQAPAHGSFSGNHTITLPATAGTLALTSGDITGNAATATALATARTIGGTSFDGTANISVGLAATATALANARTIHGVSFDGTANIDLTEVIQDTVGAMVSSNTESNITVTYEDSDGTLDFSVTGGGSVSEAFKTISVSGQSDVVADAAADTLTLVAGSNMTITTDASGDTITFASSGGGSGNSVGNAFTKNTFTGDGSTTAFTLSISASNEDNLLVFIDGVYQADNVYTVSGTTLTFATAPVNSRVIEVFTVEAGIVGSAPVIDTMTGDGSDTTLALSTTPSSENQTFVTIDGVVQHKDTYAVSGSTLTFSAAPPTGTKVECITFTNVAVTTFQDADGDTKVQVEESSDEDKIRFDTGGTERAVIDSSGLTVGDITINGSTISDGGNLTIDVAGDIILDADGGDVTFKDAGTEIAHLSNSSSDFVISSAVNDKDLKFQGVDNNSVITALTLDMSDAGKAIFNAGAILADYLIVSDGTINNYFGTDGNGGLIGTSTNHYTRFITNNTERMRIDSSGTLFIGKTGNAFATSGMELYGTGRAFITHANDDVLLLNRTGSAGKILKFYDDGSEVGSISTNTNSLPSDKNFKKNINNLDLGLNLIKKLKPSQYNYKHNDDNTPLMYGLIAQELEESLTEVGVEKNSTWLLQHNPTEDEKQSDYDLDYGKLTPILIKAIQEQQVIIDNLTTRIETLEGGE